MPKRKLTQDDLDNNPSLADQGLKVGEEIDVPESQNLDGDGGNQDLPDSGDTGGSAPPPNKERP